MDDTNLRARGTSEIVDAAFALYKQNAMQYTVITAIGYSPVLILNLIMIGDTQPTAIGDFWKIIPGLIASTLALAIVSAMVARMGSDAYLGNNVNIERTVKAVLPKLPSLIISSMLLYIMLGLSALFFIIPAFYLGARWFAISQAIVLENKGILGAFGRSSVLSKGRKIHILKTLVLTWGIYLVLGGGISLLARATGSVIVQQVVGSVFAVFAYPIVNLALMVLYYDTRIRAEGFDVEHMSQVLGASAPVPPTGSAVA